MNDSDSAEPGEIRLWHYAAQAPGALAVVDPGGRHWSRGDIAGLANSLARALRSKGLVPGDVLAIVAPNCAEYLVAYLAATQIGLYVVPVNWHLAPPEIQYILEDCRARAVVVHDRYRSVMEWLLPRMHTKPDISISLGEIPEFVRLDDFASNHSGQPLGDRVQGRPLGYTSATTGKPKGVLLPLADAERVLESGIRSRIATGTVPERHVQLCASVLYHGSPLDVAVQCLHMGSVVILMDSVAPEPLLQLIDRYRVTNLYVVPAMFTRLLGLSDEVKARYSVASLKRVMHTGAPCPVEIKRRMIEWWGPVFMEVYAATEGGGTVANCEDWLRYPGTVGRPIPGTSLQILSDEGEEQPPGAIGTIYMTRYSGDRFQYLGDAEKTRACHRGDFFTLGDVGYLNHEGFLFLCDRKIDMINLGGMKVYSAEIENVLAEHPDVVDCAVFGVPDTMAGEAIVALIQPVPGAPPERDCILGLRSFLRQHLSPVKLPRYIELVAELPREGNGKLRKRSLRQSYLTRSKNGE